MYGWLPTDCTYSLLALCCGSHSISSFAKWILKISIFFVQIGEACTQSILPRMVACGFRIAILRHYTIIVDNYFERIGVAFARSQDVGACVFEHRNEVGEHILLCIFVFNGLQHTGSLPLPTVATCLKIESMALPHGNVFA